MAEPPDVPICSHCGARNDPEAAVCALCGTPLAQPTPVPDDAGLPRPAADVPAATDSAGDPAALCPQCGAEVPEGANFCSQCGAALSSEAPAAGSPVQRQVLVLVAIGAVLVLAFFAVSEVSQQLTAPEPAPVAQAADGGTTPLPEDHAEALPLPDGVAQQVAALEAEIAQQEGAATLEARRQLVNLLVGVGRVGRAAREQEAIAEIEGTADAWRRTGDLYFDWMETLQDAQKPAVGERVVAAYDRVLDDTPGDVATRTDLATALLNTNNPMRGVEEIKTAIEQDPDYIPARFSYAAMLMMIGRLDQAVAEFEYVVGAADTTTPFYRQAQRALAELRRQMEES